MTKRQVLDDLEAYRVGFRRLDNLQQKREELRSIAFSIGSISGNNGGGHSRGPKDAKYTKAVNALVDMENEYLDDITGLKFSLEKTKKRIENCHKQSCKNVLNMYYLDCMSAMEISFVLDCTERHVFRLKSEGIEDIIKNSK